MELVILPKDHKIIKVKDHKTIRALHLRNLSMDIVAIHNQTDINATPQ